MIRLIEGHLCGLPSPNQGRVPFLATIEGDEETKQEIRDEALKKQNNKRKKPQRRSWSFIEDLFRNLQQVNTMPSSILLNGAYLQIQMKGSELNKRK